MEGTDFTFFKGYYYPNLLSDKKLNDFTDFQIKEYKTPDYLFV